MPSTGSQPEPVGRSHLRLPPPPEHPPLCREAFAPRYVPAGAAGGRGKVPEHHNFHRSAQLSLTTPLLFPPSTSITKDPLYKRSFPIHRARSRSIPALPARRPGLQHPCPAPCLAPGLLGIFPLQNEAFSLPAAPPGPAALSWGGVFAMER